MHTRVEIHLFVYLFFILETWAMIQRGGMTLYSDFLYLTPLKTSMAQALYFESKLEREEQIGNHLPGTTEHLPFVKYLLDVRQ